MVEAKHHNRLRRIERQVSNTGLATKVIPRSFLVSLVSQYDAFLGNLVRELFLLKPEILNNSEKNLKFSQLVEFGDIHKATEYIIEKEIESLLRKSHKEQFEWLENKFSINLRKGLDSWPKFIEITERRNLFVHTDGKVSSQYLRVCGINNVDVSDISVGDELSVSQKYFREAHNTIFEIGFKLSQVFWRKLAPDEIDEADGLIIDVGFELLNEERYKLANEIFSFGTKVLRKHSSEEKRRTMLINRAIALSRLGSQEECMKLLDSEDWSVCGYKFKIAVSVLKEEYEEAARIMVLIGDNSDIIPKFAYKTWPLFQDFRNQEIFKEKFKEVFDEDFCEYSEELSEQIAEKEREQE